jgi:hypothetical protein
VVVVVATATLWSCSDSGQSGTLDASMVQPSSDASSAMPTDAPTGRCVEETYPVGACDQAEFFCRPASGYACCFCVPAHASCGVSLAWVCGDLFKDCPPSPPTPGSPCTMDFPNAGCTYCDPPLGNYGCSNGTWRKVAHELYCQSPLVRD